MEERRGDASSWQQRWKLFHAALEVQPTRRSDFLDQACPDPEIRRTVEELLRAHERTLGPLEYDPVLDVSPESASIHSSDTTSLAEQPEPQPGQVLAHRFRIVRRLGRGGMGTVYEAYDSELEARLAIKVVRPEIAASEGALRRFRREIQLARQVTHPSVCRVFDLYSDGALDFLTMELVDGMTLDAWIEQKGRPSAATICSIVEQIGAALSAAHAVGIVHRDLKPTNVMLVEQGDATRIVVMDFGLARSLDIADVRGRLTVTGQALGTPSYMAPEQLVGGPVGPPTDVYALGVMLFELVTGRRPFEGDTPYSIVAKRMASDAPSPRTFAEDLDPVWERAILRCLERLPEDRFGTIAELVTALRSEVAVPLPSQRRRGFRLLTVGAAAVAAAVLSSYWLWPAGESRTTSAAIPESGLEAAHAERWILVANCRNATGEPRFDGAIDAALRRELSNSRQLRLVPRERIGDTLRLMGQPPDSLLDSESAREVALRDGRIAALVDGRIERVGSTYVLSADLVDVAAGRQIAGVSEEVTTEDDLLPAIRRLSNRVRDALGESEREILADGRRLERVTTPSLRALRLFTRADELILTDTDVAIELLSECIAEDPNFAMAHLLLAHAYRNVGRPAAEYQESAQRAFELSEHVPEREKFFIRGSYHSMHGEWDEAVKNYATLIRLHPDHRWGGNNLVNTLTALGRMAEAVPYAVLAADNQPNDFYAQAKAGIALAWWAGKQAAAEPYLARARELRNAMADPRGPLESLLPVYPAFAAWLANDAAATERALSRAEEELAPRSDAPVAAYFVAMAYSSIGRTATAAGFLERSFSGEREIQAAVLAWMRGDLESVSSLLGQLHFQGAPATSRREPLRLSLLALAGRSEQIAEEMPWLERMTRATDLERILPPHVPRLVEGALAFAAGDLESAAKLLSSNLEAEKQTGSPLYFLGSDLLTSAYDRLGRADRALRTLEAATAERRLAVPDSTVFWLRLRSRLADAYRRLGQAEKAAAVETELHALLAHSESGFPVARFVGGSRTSEDV